VPVIIDQIETTVDAPSSPTPSTPQSNGAEIPTMQRADLAKTLRRIARREARLAAD
jgi:hypothetical protein